MKRSAVTIFALISLLACDSFAQRPVLQAAGPVEVRELTRHYKWIDRAAELPGLVPLERRFPTPEGLTRVEAPEGSFAQFLRGLPVRTDRTHVESYEGKRLGSPSAAIVYLDVGEKNLQQCADSAIRLHAEWLWSKGEAESLRYHFTSGDPTAWSDWAAGERFRISGSKVERRRSGARSTSRDNFRDWLDIVFTYAGTRSLSRDSSPVEIADVQAGDFFVTPGSPGHAVVVLDVARSDDGQIYALLGQGFMPAQDFHVIEGSGSRVRDNVWWKLTPGEPIDTPSWDAFEPDTLRRFD